MGGCPPTLARQSVEGHQRQLIGAGYIEKHGKDQVPLVSATPAYVTMAQKLGIAGLCFRGPDDLVRLLRDLDYGRDVSKYRLAEIRKELLRVFSPEVIARSFLGTIG